MSNCSICFEEIIKSDFTNNYTTKCCHTFHVNCLKEWCKTNNSCPMCRTKDVMCISQYLNVCLPGSPDIFRESRLLNITPTTTTTEDSDNNDNIEENEEENNNNIINIDYNINNIINNIINNNINYLIT